MKSAALLSLALAALCGCRPQPRLLAPAGESGRATLDELLRRHPLPAGENIRATLLARTEALSHHLVQIAEGEQPHVHAHHDLTVTLLRGEGDMHLADQTVRMRAGDVVAIPRKTPHHFVNARSSPAVAFVTFAPPYDGTDQVPARP